ncbi:type II toxin-antitoxin system VapC family toxin [Sphingomonas sp. AR_OL41]|uniref:type II toxin-antitoxin system VapC family toxin n=1 Tax=Sphingomonas sp. AR_OL41 TaxID=3042729 RepID=UPI0024813CC6|nr:type II toxin-antitoxin system VapC family toxin [Sphingomonas sp. AR_OL41]MDH7973510.1 type II toxin-antitoxin system VapC family toxin [Sphingomonas sp. AR_OL41]
MSGVTGYLLDTHALIWWWLVDPALPADIMALMARSDANVHVSAISGIEIAIKVRIGKLPEMIEPLDHFDEAVLGDSFRHLPVDRRHAIRAGLMKGAHRDPFDRLLAAQALIEDLTVITRDRAFADFGCKVVW